MDNNSETQKVRTFEDILPILDNLLKMAAHKWNLKAVPSITFDDISQIIRVHVWKKFSLYDQSLPIEPWLSTIISNQIRNLLRNHYYSSVSPCLRCCENEGGNLCRTFETQSNLECPIFAKWSKGKKSAFDIRLALPLENHSQEISDIPFSDSNLEKSIILFHIEMKKILKPIEYRIYELLFIKNLSEEDAAKIMGYTSNEGRKPGYNNFIRIRKSILEKAHKIKDKIDIF